MSLAAFADFIPLRLTATVNTPPEQAVYDGRILYLPPEYLVQLGSGSGSPGQLVFGDISIRGWQEASGPTGHQFYMEPPFTAVIRDQFKAIPGARGWVDATAQAAYRTAGVALLQSPYSMPAADVVAMLKRLYDAAVANAAAVAPGG